MRRPVLTLLLAAVVLAPAAALAAAPCPPSTFSVYGTPTSLNSDAAFDTSTFAGSCDWDMAAGRVYLYSTGTLGGVTVDVHDDFDVTGVPAGTPVTVMARLSIDGAVWTTGCGGSGCGGLYEVRFWHGDDSLSVVHADHLFTGRSDHHDELALPVTITAGSPERLRVRAHGRRSPGGSHQSEADCRLTFVVQDPAVQVVSCKTYAVTPVPTRATTWGRLKVMHR